MLVDTKKVNIHKYDKTNRFYNKEDEKTSPIEVDQNSCGLLVNRKNREIIIKGRRHSNVVGPFNDNVVHHVIFLSNLN